MIQTATLIMAVSGLLVAGVGANEMTHGGLSEAMGFGHHHMADYGGHHCSAPDHDDWERHEEHMHQDGDGNHCGGGHMGNGHGGMHG